MNQENIKKIVSDFRKEVGEISDEEVGKVIRLCRRKIEITKQPESYMNVLLPDELRNHVLHRMINVVSALRI